MTSWPRTRQCLKAVVLEAVWSCQMQTHYEYSILCLLIPYYFQWFCLLTKKYLFYKTFQREPGKKKKYRNWLLLSLSVEKNRYHYKGFKEILGKKYQQLSAVSDMPIGTLFYFRALLGLLQESYILKYFRFAITQTMEFGKGLREQNQTSAMGICWDLFSSFSLWKPISNYSEAAPQKTYAVRPVPVLAVCFPRVEVSVKSFWNTISLCGSFIYTVCIF